MQKKKLFFACEENSVNIEPTILRILFSDQNLE